MVVGLSSVLKTFEVRVSHESCCFEGVHSPNATQVYVLRRVHQLLSLAANGVSGLVRVFDDRRCQKYSLGDIFVRNAHMCRRYVVNNVFAESIAFSLQMFLKSAMSVLERTFESNQDEVMEIIKNLQVRSCFVDIGGGGGNHLDTFFVGGGITMWGTILF